MNNEIKVMAGLFVLGSLAMLLCLGVMVMEVL